MAESAEKIIKIYDQICDYFEAGKLALTLIQAMREEYQGKPERQDDIFVATLVISAYNTVILSLANTVKPNDKSVHLQYLINCIKNSKGALNTKSRIEFNTFIDQLENIALKTITPTIDRVIEFRDKSVAHLDRDHINNPGSLLQKPPISWEEIELAYHVVDSALKETGKYIGVRKQEEKFIGLAYLELKKQTWKVLHLIYGGQ